MLGSENPTKIKKGEKVKNPTQTLKQTKSTTKKGRPGTN